MFVDYTHSLDNSKSWENIVDRVQASNISVAIKQEL